MVPLQSQQWVDFYAVTGFRNHAVNFGTCGFALGPGSTIATAYSCYNYYKDSDKNVAVSLEKKNRFRVQVWNGQVTFYLNGVKVCQDYAPEWLAGDMSQCKMGFAAGDIPKGTSIVVSNIEVRFLKSKPPLPFQ